MKKTITQLLSLLLTAVLLAGLCVPALAAAKDAPAPEPVPGRRWLRELADGGVRCCWGGKSELPAYTALPAQRPAKLPEGFALSGIEADPIHQPNTSAVWTWLRREGGETQVLRFTCFRPQAQACGVNFGAEFDAASLRRDAKVQGCSADYFQIPVSSQADLFWEDRDGNLFHLSAPRELGQAAVEEIANSVKEVPAEPLPACQMGWTPKGFCRSRSAAALLMASETWTRYTYPENQPAVRETLRWRWSRGVQASVPEGRPETVTVKGVQAQYWPGDPDAGYVDAASVGGRVIQVVPAPEQTGTLVWTDPKTEITFRVDGPFDKAVLIRMAESVALP